MKFRFTMKKILLTLLFIADEMKVFFKVLGVVGVNRPIKKCKQTRARYRGNHVGNNNADIFTLNFYVKSTQQLRKI